jgi:hypothetical protein
MHEALGVAVGSGGDSNGFNDLSTNFAPLGCAS